LCHNNYFAKIKIWLWRYIFVSFGIFEISTLPKIWIFYKKICEINQIFLPQKMPKSWQNGHFCHFSHSFFENNDYFWIKIYKKSLECRALQASSYRFNYYLCRIFMYCNSIQVALGPSLYAVFLSENLRICDWKMVFFLEPIL